MGVSHLPFLIILAVVALIVFGPKRLPELGHGLGRAITEFKKGTSDLVGSHQAPADTVQPVAAIAASPVEPQPTAPAPEPSARA